MSGAVPLGRRLIPALAIVVALLVGVNVAIEIYQHVLDGERFTKLIAFLSTDNEANLPTWFSALLLSACAAMAWLIGAAERRLDGRHWKHWLGVAGIFLYLSLDETGRVHERTIDPLRDLLGGDGLLEFTWIVVAIPVVIATAVFYAGFVRALPRPVRWRLTAAAVLYVAGAIGTEAASGAVRSAHGDGLGYGLLTCFEEGLEMAAVVLALAALAAYAGSRLTGVRLRLEDGRFEVAERDPP